MGNLRGMVGTRWLLADEVSRIVRGWRVAGGIWKSVQGRVAVGKRCGGSKRHCDGGGV